MRGQIGIFTAFLVLAACGGDPSKPGSPVEESTPQFPTTTVQHTDPAPAPLCTTQAGDYEATREPSNVLFLYDRSGSMHIELPSNLTRWEAMRAGFFELLAALPPSTAAGLMLFPQGDAPVNKWCGIDASINDVTCKSGWPEPSESARCDASGYAPQVPSALLEDAQVSQLESTIHASDNDFYWGTPLSTAMKAAIASQRASTLPGAKSIILLTDGNPTSCGDEGISNDIGPVLDEVKVGLDNNGALVRTFVIGLTDSSRQAAKASNLSPIAIAGGTKRTSNCEQNDSCFYALSDDTFADDLKKVFDAVSLQAFDCTFNLPVASGAIDPAQINVQLSSTTVNRDPNKKDGWEFLPNGTQIQLYGAACTAMKTANAKLRIVLGCPTIVQASPPDDLTVK
jgi:hypothetical protein